MLSPRPTRGTTNSSLRMRPDPFFSSLDTPLAPASFSQTSFFLILYVASVCGCLLQPLLAWRTLRVAQRVVPPSHIVHFISESSRSSPLVDPLSEEGLNGTEGRRNYFFFVNRENKRPLAPLPRAFCWLFIFPLISSLFLVTPEIRL